MTTPPQINRHENLTQNGIGEKLLLEGGVSGITDDQGAEHGSNTSSGSSDTDGGGSSSDELGGGVNVCPGSRCGDEGGLVDGGADRSGGSQGQTGADGQASDGRHSCVI